MVYPVYHIRLITKMIFADMYSGIIEFREIQFRNTLSIGKSELS